MPIIGIHFFLNSFAIILGDGVCRAVYPPYQSCQSEEKVNIQMIMFTFYQIVRTLI